VNRKIVLTGIVLITISILLGAFGAHGLKSIVSSEKLISFETGVKYQMYQGLAFIIIGLNYSTINFINPWFYRLGLVGILLFSGSIYFLTITDLTHLPKLIFIPLTPIGGGLLITSWLFLFVSILKQKVSK
jgi:uncharacterized membrane protein YgdD (TMEM256/DUF423 family)